MIFRFFLSLLTIFISIILTKVAMGEYNALYVSGLFQVTEKLILSDQGLQLKTTYPNNISKNSTYNLVVILNEDNSQLETLVGINELAHYLSSHGFITCIINFKNEKYKQNFQELISNNIRWLLKYFKKEAYKITHTALIGHNINSRISGYYNIDYEPINIIHNELATLIITSKICDTAWNDLKKVTCIKLTEKIDVKQLYFQIKFWLQIHLLSCPVGFIKTADSIFGNITCEAFPRFVVDDVLFPFHPKHPVHCIQGSMNKFPYSHFFQNTMYAIDLASPKESLPGKIYASFDGIAYIYNKCKTNNNNKPNYCGYGYGNYIYILRSDGIFASYAHLDKIYVKNKQQVKKGELIGLEGSTGLAGLRHLHFSLHLLGIDSVFFNTHTRGHVTVPFLLKIKKNNLIDAKKIISYNIPVSQEELIYGDWE